MASTENAGGTLTTLGFGGGCTDCTHVRHSITTSPTKAGYTFTNSAGSIN